MVQFGKLSGTDLQTHIETDPVGTDQTPAQKDSRGSYFARGLQVCRVRRRRVREQQRHCIL